ncbi:MAG: DUF4976 domain-containing protein [Bacteroidetes bacterium]|nr:MAG: DUF4976 domain-containing protein [Bacteroidota bacterium]
MKNTILALINQKIWLVIFCFLCLHSCEETDQQTTIEKPNIVLIFSDDQNFQTINALGNQEIHTPNLDRLVDMGTTFSHAYNMGSWTGAVCVPSRTMMVTGRSVWDARKIIPEIKSDSSVAAQTWPMLMKSAGYETYMTGKWHVVPKPEEVFDKVMHERPGMPGDAWINGNLQPKFKAFDAGELTWDEIMPVGYNRPKTPDDMTWSPYDTTHGGYWEGGMHWSEVLKNDAIGFIEKAKNKAEPFFMYLAFNAPHDPRQAPKEFIDLYDPETLSVPENFLPEHPFKEAMGCSGKLRDEALAPFPRTPFSIQKNKQEYYAIITHMDAQIGLIIDALESSGKMDNTYIFFTSDHGLAMGQHGLLGKQSLYDHSIRVPLIAIGKDIPQKQTIDHDVYLQDIMATSLELAEVEKPAHIFFHSLMDLAKNKREESYYPSIYGAYTNTQRMIRKNGLKLIVLPKAEKVMLFDLKKDPLEMNDLVELEEYQPTVTDLFEELIALQKELNDDLDLNEFFEEIKNPSKQ